jgi:hypothetical protein
VKALLNSKSSVKKKQSKSINRKCSGLNKRGTKCKEQSKVDTFVEKDFH